MIHLHQLIVCLIFKKKSFNYSIANHLAKVCAQFNLNKDFDNLLKRKNLKMLSILNIFIILKVS